MMQFRYVSVDNDVNIWTLSVPDASTPSVLFVSTPSEQAWTSLLIIEGRTQTSSPMYSNW
jgi:hypothetical protein